jgi:hypothetical protein
MYMGKYLEKVFRLSQYGTNIKTEMIAGITTFVESISYAADKRYLLLASVVSISEKFFKCISELPTANENTTRKNSSAISNPFSSE